MLLWRMLFTAFLVVSFQTQAGHESEYNKSPYLTKPVDLLAERVRGWMCNGMGLSAHSTEIKSLGYGACRFVLREGDWTAEFFTGERVSFSVFVYANYLRLTKTPEYDYDQETGRLVPKSKSEGKRYRFVPVD